MYMDWLEKMAWICKCVCDCVHIDALESHSKFIPASSLVFLCSVLAYQEGDYISYSLLYYIVYYADT